MTPRMLTLLRFLLVAEWDRRIIGCGRNGSPLSPEWRLPWDSLNDFADGD